MENKNRKISLIYSLLSIISYLSPNGAILEQGTGIDCRFAQQSVGCPRCPATVGRVSTGHPDESGFDSPNHSQKQKHPGWGAFAFGAGYGNRTRLCGLGSDHSTDELTLRFLYYIRKGGQFQYPFCIQDPTSGSRPQRAKDRQKHLTAFEINCGQVKIRDNNSKSNRKSKSVRIRVSKRKKKRKTNNKNICAESCPKRERER